MIDMDEADTAQVVGMGDSRDEGKVVHSQYRWTHCDSLVGRDEERMFRRNERKPYGDEVCSTSACCRRVRSVDRGRSIEPTR